MLRAFQDLTTKEKWIFFLLLVAGYISPVIGVVVYFFARKKTENKLLQYASLAGAALALVVYVAEYMYLLWTPVA